MKLYTSDISLLFWGKIKKKPKSIFKFDDKSMPTGLEIEKIFLFLKSLKDKH